MGALGVLGPLEGEVMQVMWGRERATVRDVLGELVGRRPVAYTTVMTVMNNLVTKGLLERAPRGKAFIYEAALTRQALLDRKSREAVGDVLARFGDLAIARFIEAVAELTPEDMERLKQLAQGDAPGQRKAGAEYQTSPSGEARVES